MTTKQVHEEAFAKALQVQHHRGPDNTQQLHHHNIWLGHNRLSILDLSSNGSQPMLDSTGRYALVLNGEIYNYIELREKYLKQQPLVSGTDTEVLLYLLITKGEAILPDLLGMFSFVWVDYHTQNILAVRDRFGVKPLYYCGGQGLSIASEIKTLHALGIAKSANEKVWAGYLANAHYGDTHETFWEQIQQLPGGHLLRYRVGEKSIDIKQWYDFVAAGQQYLDLYHLSESEWLKKYELLMDEAVALRFRSDVPVGVNLSGGLDSSLLFKIITHTSGIPSHLHAFTFYTNDERYDEIKWVENLLENSNLQLNKVLLTPEMVPALSKALSWHQDEPFGGFPTLAYANCFAAARRAGIPVILDGQGIDEAWAGYDYYFAEKQSLVQGAGTSSATKANTLAMDLRMLASPLQFSRPFDNALQNLQYRDIRYTKIPRALRFNDRISMMHSVELREPCLDHRLVEMAFYAPLTHKYQQGINKFLLRQKLGQSTNKALAFAPKRALQTPQREWLRTVLSAWASEQIETMLQSKAGRWFNADEVMSEWKAYLAGQSDNSFYIWQWINTALIFA